MKNLILESKSKTDASIKIYGYANKKTINKINELLLEYDLENFFIKNEIIKYCLYCGKKIKKENKFCDSSCSATYNNKKRILTDKTKNKISESVKKKILEDKKNGVFKLPSHQIDKKVEKICPICNEKFKVPKCESDHIYCSRKCYLNDKELKYRSGGKGGYREGSQLRKRGRYKKYWCDSSYELAFVIYNIDHNILFEKNTEKFEYYYKNKLHYYIPDFKMNDGSYIEIKGYLRDQDKYKFEYFPHKLILLKKDDLKYVFDYVINKYGKNFIEMYDNNPQEQKKIKK